MTGLWEAVYAAAFARECYDHARTFGHKDALLRAAQHAETARDVADACLAVVEAPTRVDTPYDGGPALRPHSAPGWWQVWSGGICIALLAPDDVGPLVGAENAKAP